LQAFGLLLLFDGKVRFDRQAVVLPVAFEHLLRRCFEFVGLMREIGPRAAPGFGGLTRQLDAIDGEHFPTDQPLPVTQVQHLRKASGDFLIEAGNEGGERGEVRG
jgi:hypothetical protein